MNHNDIASFISKTARGFEEKDFPGDTNLYKGKVRDVFKKEKELLIYTSDRISAFDRILTTIPFKGEILNNLSLYWFDRTKDIIPNHVIKKVSPRSMLVKRCEVLPVEVIVRGYLTGSAWRDYKKGNSVSGIKLPGGMTFNERFNRPLITPSTKAEEGHDLPVSAEEIVKQGLVDGDVWAGVEKAALSVFQRGTELADRQGLILVDTKYEFGLLDGELILVDEVHTPDSSRFWYSDTYEELFKAGKKQRKIDKEYLRQWLMEQGFSGDGDPPVIPDDVRVEVAYRYIKAYELITGSIFTPESLDLNTEKNRIIEICE